MIAFVFAAENDANNFNKKYNGRHKTDPSMC